MSRWDQTLREPRLWVRDIVFTAGSVVTITLLGPYGSYDLPLEGRLVVSVANGFLGGLWLWPVMRLVIAQAERSKVPVWFAIVFGLAVLAVPVAGIAHLVAATLGSGRSPPAPQLYLAVLAMVLPFGAAYLYVDRWLERSHATPPAASSPEPPRLLGRVPAKLGRDVIALQAEDHYVRVHTALGSDLVLMRLADAIAEADGIEGLRVHRSWWVARHGVLGGKAEGRRAVLTLANGAIAPVTRDAVPEVRRAGWI